MKNTLKILGISLALFGCLSQNIEIKPVKKVTDCLIKEITTVKGVKPVWIIETQLFNYDENGNPTTWTIFNEKGNVNWQLIIEYENNRLKKVTKREYTYLNNIQTEENNSIKTYEIKDDFSEIIVSEVTLNSRLKTKKESIPQKLYFSRNPKSGNELKFDESYYVELKNHDKQIEPAAIYRYDFEKNNALKKYDLKNGILTEANGFWKNVKNPFNANIWLSLIANYWTDWDLEGGDWNKNMESIETGTNTITTYETNVEGFPCKLTAKQIDFVPLPVEVSFYYHNCDCK